MNIQYGGVPMTEIITYIQANWTVWLSFFDTVNEGKQRRKLVLCEDRRKDLRVCVWEVHRRDLEVFQERSQPCVH